MARLAIYQRLKEPRGNNKVWRYRRVEEGRGVKTGQLQGPFHIRPTQADGSQPWITLDAATFEQAKLERDKREKGIELAAENVEGRTTIAAAIEDYLDSKKRKNDSTVQNYTHILNEFLEQLAPSVKFIDQVDRKILNSHMTYLENERAAEPKTLQNKLGVIFQMLKAAGVPAPSKLTELPTVEEEIAEPYTKADLKKLFEQMTDEEMVRYTFFLDTACREKEVAHATWDDIKDGKYIVRTKTYTNTEAKHKKFSPKSHQVRQIPLTRELIDMLGERGKSAARKWIFPNEQGDPEGHFLRKFKKIAFKAGLNCGECHVTRNEGRYQKTAV